MSEQPDSLDSYLESLDEYVNACIEYKVRPQSKRDDWLEAKAELRKRLQALLTLEVTRGLLSSRPPVTDPSRSSKSPKGAPS